MLLGCAVLFYAGVVKTEWSIWGVALKNRWPKQDKSNSNKKIRPGKSETHSAKSPQTRKLRVGNIRGEWTLYSSAWLEHVQGDISQEDPDQMEGFEVGTIEWDDFDLERLVDPNVDLGAQFQIISSEPSEHYEGFHIEFKTPKWASATPLKLMCCIVGGGNGDSPYIPVKLTFLGSGMFKMVFRGKDLKKTFKGKGEFVFVGMHTKKEAQVNREKEEFSEEWRNCRYTGQWHPDNWDLDRLLSE